MRSRKMMLFGKKGNNRGMSLVEVIVAITILGLVAVSVLHSLTTAMVYNQKARNRQEMTLTAESIMETFKGYDLDELKVRFGLNKEDGSMESGILDYGVVSGVKRGIEGVSCEAVDGASGYHYDTTTIPLGVENAEQYTFHIDDMKLDNEQELYNVEIIATPNEAKKFLRIEEMEGKSTAIYKGDKSVDKGAKEGAFTHLKDYDYNPSNDTEGKLEDVLFANDAFIRDAGLDLSIKNKDGNKDTDVINKLYDSNSAASVLNYLQLRERKLVFTISESDDGLKYKVTQEMQYGYMVKDYPYYVVDESASAPVEDEYPDSESSEGTEGSKPVVTKKLKEAETPLSFSGNDSLIWYTVDSGDIYENPKTLELNRLFIYYYPQYDNGIKDTIEVDNKAGVENFECYMLKQRAQDMKDTTTGSKEEGYKPEVKITNSAPKFLLFHNFDYNIGKFEEMASGFPATIAGAHKVYSYTEDVSPLVEEEEAVTLSYKLELTIKRASDDQPVVTLESTMNEKII